MWGGVCIHLKERLPANCSVFPGVGEGLTVLHKKNQLLRPFLGLVIAVPRCLGHCAGDVITLKPASLNFSLSIIYVTNVHRTTILLPIHSPHSVHNWIEAKSLISGPVVEPPRMNTKQAHA